MDTTLFFDSSCNASTAAFSMKDQIINTQLHLKGTEDHRRNVTVWFGVLCKVASVTRKVFCAR